MRKPNPFIIAPVVADFMAAHVVLCSMHDDGRSGKWTAQKALVDKLLAKLTEEQRGYAGIIASGLARLLEPSVQALIPPARQPRRRRARKVPIGRPNLRSVA